MDRVRNESIMNNFNRLSDEELILSYRKGNRAAKDLLCQRYIPLVKKLITAPFVYRFREDLEQALWIIFCERIESYDVKKAKFSTMISKILRFERANYFRREKKRWIHEVSGIIKEKSSEEIYVRLEREEISCFLKEFEKQLSKQALEVFRKLLTGYLSERQLAEKLGVSRHSIRKCKKEIRNTFYSIQKSLQPK